MPTLIATLTPTPTLGQSATPSGTPGPSVTPSGFSTPSVDLAVARARERCQKTINRAAGAFVVKKLRSLDRCANGILECIQTIANGERRDDCVVDAATRCTREIDKIVHQQSVARTSIVAMCGALPLVLDDLTSADGLGYSAITECGPSVDTVEDIADCVVEHHSCEIEHVFDVEEPRARDLMEFAQVPPSRLAVLSCLPSHGGGGQDVDMETTIGRAITRCETAITRAGANLIRKELSALGRCTVRAMSCEESKRGDARCPARASRVCATEFGKIKTQKVNTGPSIDKKCAPPLIDFDFLRRPDGANLAASAAECEQFGVSPLDDLEQHKQCLQRQHQCRVEALLRLQAPRAEALIGNLDFEPPFQFPSDCPPTP